MFSTHRDLFFGGVKQASFFAIRATENCSQPWPTLLTRPDILPLGFQFWYMRSLHVLDILAVVIVLLNNICDNDLVMIT